MRIYVASSWRNPFQPYVVSTLRSEGHEVYDFRNPTEGDNGFHWREIDGGWQEWSSERYVAALSHPVAEAGFKKDRDALDWCEACVLVLPCGRSAHLELGYAIGQKKPSAILMPDPTVPLALVGGHSWHRSVTCSACGDLDGCHMPAKVMQVEPELMNKLADRVCLSLREVREWLGLRCGS